MVDKLTSLKNEEISTVDRVTYLNYEEFVNQYLKLCKPVIIKNATKQWQAHQAWDFDFFQNNYSDRQIRIDEKTYKFSNFIDLVLNGNPDKPAPYLREMNIPIFFPELMADLQPRLQYTLPDRLTSKLLPKVLERSWGMRKGMVELLIGGTGARFPFLHYDLFKSHGFVTQIRGDKEFYFYPPSDSEYLYPMDSQKDFSSIVNLENVDLQQFPLFPKAQQIKVVVREGESIFIPSGWWHTTKIITPSIAIHINFINADKWLDFIDESYGYYYSRSPIKAKILRIYLFVIGILMQ